MGVVGFITVKFCRTAFAFAPESIIGVGLSWKLVSMATPLSSIFKSVKSHHPVPKPNPSSSSTPSKSLPIKSSQSPSSSSPPNSASKSKSNSRWSVYLILSTNPPIKTYVGVTTNFSRRFRNDYLLLKLPVHSRRDVFESGWKVGLSLLFDMKFKNGILIKRSYSFDGIQSG
nr:structure-specific endonuclease subunit slx1 [Ipomoea batatas]